MQTINRRIAPLFLAAFAITVCIAALSPQSYSLWYMISGGDQPTIPPLYPHHVLKDETRLIALVPGHDNAQTIYESDLVIVQVDERQFVAYQEWAGQNDRLPTPLPSLGELAADAAVDYGGDNYLHPKNRILIADFLRSGSISVYDKRHQVDAPFIQVRDFAYDCGPACGSGDWNFTFPDGTIFLTVNYMMM
jgi:hypothetical protein